MLKINLSVDATELDAGELRVNVELVIDDTVPIKVYVPVPEPPCVNL